MVVSSLHHLLYKNLQAMTKLLLTHLFCILSLYSFSQIADSQTSSTTNSSSSDRFSELNWFNESNGFESDDQHIAVQANYFGQMSNYIVLKGFNFQVPYNAAIVGISVHVERSGSGIGQKIKDEEVRLTYNNQLIGRDESNQSTWSYLDEVITYGGRLNNWNTDLSATDINSESFGVAIAVKMDGKEVLPTALIDQVEITVHFSNALPVKMLSFVASTSHNNKTHLKWQTGSEINNDYFSVERSLDGERWETIGQVNGKGNSTEVNEYEFFDITSPNAWTYYRLKQVDFNGVFEYSSVEAVKGRKIQLISEVYPNPSNGSLFVRASSDVTYVTLFDSMGREILRAQPVNGLLSDISLVNASKGVGIIKAETNDGSISINKFIYQ